MNPQESAEAIVREYGTPESGRAEPKGERKPMRSHEEQRQQNIPKGSSRQRDTVKLEEYAGAPSSSSAQIAPSSREDQSDLLERMLEGENLRLGYKRVVQNGGAPGVDGVTVSELQAYLKTHWETVKSKLLEGTYRPMPVKRVEIPKPGGGVRLLGIPTVMDRFLQQALLQVMNPIFDPYFCGYSYGFRPGKRAHDAVKQAQRHIQIGLRWVVDIDLEKFFDGVNHDMLMARVARKVTDKRVLKLIRAYLSTGVMVDFDGGANTESQPLYDGFDRIFSSGIGKDAPSEIRPVDSETTANVPMEASGNGCEHASVNCGRSASPSGFASRWPTRAEAHGKCPGIRIMPFQLPTGKRRG